MRFRDDIIVNIILYFYELIYRNHIVEKLSKLQKKKLKANAIPLQLQPAYIYQSIFQGTLYDRTH